MKSLRAAVCISAFVAAALTLFWMVANMQQFAHAHGMGPGWPGALACAFGLVGFALIPSG